MSDNDFIGFLLEETFQTVTAATQADFDHRRELSRMPVQAFAGESPLPGVLRFTIQGLILDFPRSFGPGPSITFTGRVRTIVQERAFFDVMAPLIEPGADRLFLLEASDGVPWMVFWDSKEGDFAARVRDLFRPAAPALCRKAA